jgi:hypothetical protein
MFLPHVRSLYPGLSADAFDLGPGSLLDFGNLAPGLGFQGL